MDKSIPQKLEYGAGTNVGLVRSNNEDTYLAAPEHGLWLIADGMGGHDAGEVASSIVKESVLQSVKDGISLKDAIRQSHLDVKEAARQNIGSPNMGTTIVALLTNSHTYQIGWVGDSRAYLWDPLSQKFTQLSKDHSYVQALLDSGVITPEEVQHHAQKNIITQSLGVSELEDVQVDTIEGQWRTGQKIILCSDGLSDLVDHKELSDIVRKHHSRSNQELVDTLIETALGKGGIDNVSVEVISAPSQIQTATGNAATPSRIVFAGGIILLAMLVAWAFLQ